MPANVVKKGQEDEWDRAKAIIKKNYPNISEGSSRFWKLVMSIFKNMTGKTKSRSSIERAAKS